MAALALVCALGCGDDAARTDAGAEDTGASSIDAGRDTGREEPDARMPIDSGRDVDAGAVAPTCAPPQLDSPCGPRALIRLTASLPEGMAPMTGRLMAGLIHRRLGDGSMEAVPHTVSSRADVTMSPGVPIDVELDFCEGGEMWSEENCDFMLFAFLDLNGDYFPDDGEPLKGTVIEVSCHATESPCYSLELDCLDASCRVVANEGACMCAGSCADVGSATRITTCLP